MLTSLDYILISDERAHYGFCAFFKTEQNPFQMQEETIQKVRHWSHGQRQWAFFIRTDSHEENENQGRGISTKEKDCKEGIGLWSNSLVC